MYTVDRFEDVGARASVHVTSERSSVGDVTKDLVI